MAYHSSRAHQNAMCKAECEDDHFCYLGADCVVGGEILPYADSAEQKCCMVSRNLLFNRTVRDILIHAELLAQDSTQH